MDEYVKNRWKAVFVAIISIVLVLLIYVFSQKSKINQLSFNAKSPYSITISNEKSDYSKDCLVDLCSIDVDSQKGSYTAYKDGFSSISGEFNIDNKSSKGIVLNFETMPFLESIDSKPFKDNRDSYNLIYDDDLGVQKLVKTGDVLEKSIVYFNDNLTDYKVFSGNKDVLIINGDGAIYNVDLVSKTRSEIINNSILNVKDLELSNKGDFVFTKNDDNDLYFYSKGEISKITLNSDDFLYKWGNKNILYILEKTDDSVMVYTFDSKTGSKDNLYYKNSVDLTGYWPTDFYVLGDDIALLLVGDEGNFRINMVK